MGKCVRIPGDGRKTILTGTGEVMDKNRLNECVRQVDSLSGKFERGEERALLVDLEKQTCSACPIPAKWVENYVSGPALAARIWAEYAGEQLDNPTDCEASNPVVITTSYYGDDGVIAFRSPQTGALYFNYCPAVFSAKIIMCGFSAVIVTGRLEQMGYVKIRSNGADVVSGENLRDLTVRQVEQYLGKDVLTVGPAGERYVPYAALVGPGGVCGRGGAGLVLGLKNVKALVFDSADRVVRNGVSAAEINTFQFMAVGKKNGWIPLDNYRYRTDPRLFHLSEGEALRKWPELKKNSRIKTTAEGKLIPDYDALVMLGANTGCFGLGKIAERYNTAVDLGLDPVSLGNVLGWLKEAQEKKCGYLPFEVDFTDNGDVLPLIEKIARGEPSCSSFEKLYAQSPFAYSINGLECGSCDYRGCFAEALNCALGNWFPAYVALNPVLVEKAAAFWVALNEELVMGLQSLGIRETLFVRRILALKGMKLGLLTVFREKAWLSLMPFDELEKLGINGEDVLRLGRKCRRLVREINRCISGKKPALPEYFCSDPRSNCAKPSIVPFSKLLDSYSAVYRRICTLQDSVVR